MPNLNSPEYRIHKNAFSADIDHTVMTGGTFDIRKVVEMVTDHPRIHPQIVLFPVENSPRRPSLHKGMHTLEHGLAYKGGVRDELVRMNPGMDRNTLLDISPYLHKDGRIGFRILSMDKLDPALFQHAMAKALATFGDYLHSGADIPFANEEQCGQFSFHDRAEAEQIVMMSQRSLEFQTPEASSFSPHVAVSDLRLLKPELANKPGEHFLTPEVSYSISQNMEATFATSWRRLGYGAAPQLFVGTYGCMTGMYVVAEAPTVEEDETLFEDQVHAALTMSLLEIQRTTPDDTTLFESHMALTLIRKYSPQAFKPVS